MFTKNNKDDKDKADKSEAATADKSEAATAAKSKQESAAAKKTAPPTRTVSYIGPGLSFSGEVEVDEGLCVEGQLEGSITGSDKNIVIGKKGQVKGEIRGSVIEVRGAVDGEIYGSVCVRLYSTAVIDGAIYCKKLVMDEGALLNGTVDMKWKEEAKKPARLKSVEVKESENKAAG